MSLIRSLLLVPVLAFGLSAGEATPPVPATPADAAAKPKADPLPTDPAELRKETSYQLGVMLMQNQMKGLVQKFGLDTAQVLAGMQDANAGKATAPSEERIEKLMQAQAAAVEKGNAVAGTKRKESNPAWLAENGKRPGIKTTTTGLQYEVIQAGPGKSAKPVMGGDVECHYKGTLIDGTQFDASTLHGSAPATFQVGQVIAGWNEALQLMQEGDKWRLFIPSELAYGEQAPPSIGPNQILIFEIELVKVAAAAPGKPGQIKLAP